MTFAEEIYAKLCTVPKGKVTTYKALAAALGSTAYRAVGQAMRHNPHAPIVPCHRVVASDGRIGGFNGKTGGEDILRKIRLLKEEGVTVLNGKVQNFPEVHHQWRA